MPVNVNCVGANTIIMEITQRVNLKRKNYTALFGLRCSTHSLYGDSSPWIDIDFGFFIFSLKASQLECQ